MDYFVEYYKEKDTDPMVFLQRFRCTTEPIGGGTEHDEEGELVSWDAAVAAIEIAKKQLGWRTASELPPLDDKKNSKPVIAICGIPDPLNYGRVLPRFSAVIGGAWADKDVKWWCYPPEEG